MLGTAPRRLKGFLKFFSRKESCKNGEREKRSVALF